MILAAAAAQSAAKPLTLGWFDGVVVIVLAFGIFRGRRNGMSKELLPFLQWIILVPFAGFLYPFAGRFFINVFHLSTLESYVAGYVTLAAIVLLIFSILKKLFMERMEKSNLFGNGEFYIGMLSGLVRMACIIIAVLALLNAPVYTQAEIEAHAAYVKKNFGGGMYSGDYFPTVQEIQEQIFEDSATGPFVKDNLGFFLINTTAAPAPEKPEPKISIGQ
jgi:uncharacterized membrane protein required for colicin V production